MVDLVHLSVPQDCTLIRYMDGVMLFEFKEQEVKIALGNLRRFPSFLAARYLSETGQPPTSQITDSIPVRMPSKD